MMEKFESRQKQLQKINQEIFDVAIIGGGIKGAWLYRSLCDAGYRTVLVEKEDFGGGTSQASSMMIWGGLLYLRNWDFATVYKLCSARNAIFREFPSWVHQATFRYFPKSNEIFNQLLLRPTVWCYNLLNKSRRWQGEQNYLSSSTSSLVNNTSNLVIHEEMVKPSDARFLLHLVLSHQNQDQIPLNYCSVKNGGFDKKSGVWSLQLYDSVLGDHSCAKVKWVINAGGIWTDKINAQFGIESPYMQVYSKGVTLALSLPNQQEGMVFDSKGTVMPLIPWGPVVLWGPTETSIANPEKGFSATIEDIKFLLEELSTHLNHSLDSSNIVSLRCGVRGLAVDNNSSKSTPTEKLSRCHRIYVDPWSPWISLYGGNFTNSRSIAEDVKRIIQPSLAPLGKASGPIKPYRSPTELELFPSLSYPVPSVRWCIVNEMCWTMEDYLRRRTNIAQWVQRGGLGCNDEHVFYLEEIAEAFDINGITTALPILEGYRLKIKREFDDLLGQYRKRWEI